MVVINTFILVLKEAFLVMLNAVYSIYKPISNFIDQFWAAFFNVPVIVITIFTFFITGIKFLIKYLR